jgi:hypothetical protein
MRIKVINPNTLLLQLARYSDQASSPSGGGLLARFCLSRGRLSGWFRALRASSFSFGLALPRSRLW